MPTKGKILIVEDTSSVALVFQSYLERAGFDSEIVGTVSEALAAVRTGKYSLVLLDLQLPDGDGVDVLDVIQQEGIPATVVVVTSSGSINLAVQTMQKGAYDFLVKPASEERVVVTVKNALRHEVLQSTIKEIKAEYGSDAEMGIIGSSLPMIALRKSIKAVATSKANVFIVGESGTGKELCAAAIHKFSARAPGKFVALNCASIPKDLLESEVFGHVKGAFTGATSDREGAASSAHNGTLFLDEICELELSLQAKLLRFLQTGTVQKVGSDKLEAVDVRIVCATNRDVFTEVEEGRFREDLFYRLHVIPVEISPLRERDGDVVEIAQSLLTQISEEEGKSFEGFDDDAQNLMLEYAWPGNVRELQNVVRNAVVLNEGNEISANMLSIAVQDGPKRRPQPSGISKVGASELVVDLNQTFAEIERRVIEASISRNSNSIPKASEILELSPSTIYRKKESWSQDPEGSEEAQSE